MKIRAFRLKDTGKALLLASERPTTECTHQEVWVPRSIIVHLRVWSLRPGQEGMVNMVHADIPSWFVRQNPELEFFKEV